MVKLLVRESSGVLRPIGEAAQQPQVALAGVENGADAGASAVPVANMTAMVGTSSGGVVPEVRVGSS